MAMKNMTRALRVISVAGLASLLGACNTLETTYIASHGSSRGAGVAPSPTPHPVSPSDQAAVLPLGAADIDCPQIEVQDGTAALRVGGASNESVRYQFDITETARECQPTGALFTEPGAKFTVKVGVAGHLLIGPAGSPGAYNAQLRIVVRRESDQKPVYSKAYRIDANTAGANQASFQMVSEAIPLPYTRKEADLDFTILVGFDNGHGGIAQKPPRQRLPH